MASRRFPCVCNSTHAAHRLLPNGWSSIPISPGSIIPPCQLSQRELAERQHALHGMLSFELQQGSGRGHRSNECRPPGVCGYWVRPSTWITHPVSMTHGDVPREMRERIGITEGLVVVGGLEDPRDIIADLARARRGAQQRAGG